jgi:hypothetical protein
MSSSTFMASTRLTDSVNTPAASRTIFTALISTDFLSNITAFKCTLKSLKKGVGSGIVFGSAPKRHGSPTLITKKIVFKLRIILLFCVNFCAISISSLWIRIQIPDSDHVRKKNICKFLKIASSARIFARVEKAAIYPALRI